MSPTRRSRILESATDSRLLEKQAFIALVALTTMVHLVTSIDLGFQRLEVRLPLALLSILPLYAILWVAHRVVRKFPRSQVPLIFLAYLLGGGIRGALLERALIDFGVVNPEAVAFRIPAGITLITGSAMTISYAWSTIQDNRFRLAALESETAALQEAYALLNSRTAENQEIKSADLSREIVERVSKIGSALSTNQRDELQKLVDDVVRPLSRRFASNIPNWRPSQRSAEISLRRVHASLDPIKHLPPRTVAVIAVITASIASSSAFFGWKAAIELIVLVVLGLALSMTIGYPIARRYVRNLRPPLRDLEITLGFMIMAIPPALGTRIALSETQQPRVYVVPALIAVPIFGWIIMTGNAAREQASISARELLRTRDELRWHIARINLLTWFHNGLASRLLHGPIQNAIQVGIFRIRALDNEADSGLVVRDVLSRIDEAFQRAASLSPTNPKEACEIIAATWNGIASISTDVSDQTIDCLESDQATAGILVDLVQEACSNSIRHGGADRVQIACSTGDSLVRVVIEDNGDEFKESGLRGLGTQFLEACAVSWSRTRSDGTNRLTIDLPAVTSSSPMSSRV